MSEPFVYGTTSTPIRVTPTGPAETVWAALWTQLQPSAKTTLDLFAQMLTVFRANPEIALLIQAAAPSGPVGGAGMSKEQAAAIATLGTALGVFMATPVADGGFTPAQLIHRIWPAPVVAPPAPVVAPSVAPDAPPVLPDAAPMP